MDMIFTEKNPVFYQITHNILRVDYGKIRVDYG